MITQDDVKLNLHYDENTGIFTRIKSNHHSVKIGEVAGTDNRGYVMISINHKKYSGHRLAWLYVYGELPEYIDHINGNRSDNRLCNLRPANKLTNNYNSKLRKDNVSGVKGVTWSIQLKKWAARISINGYRKFLGYFDDLEFAELVTSEARLKYHGEFARDK